MVQLKLDWYLDTLFGRFGYDQILNQQYGTKVASKNNKGHAYVLWLDP